VINSQNRLPRPGSKIPYPIPNPGNYCLVFHRNRTKYHQCWPVFASIQDVKQYCSSNTIWYDSVYLTCSKKLTGSQLSPPHGTNKKLKCETKNKPMSMIGPVQSRCHEGSPVDKRNLRWEGFVEKVGFETGVKEWWMMRVVMIIEMSWQVNEEVSRDMTGEADWKNPGVDFTDGVMMHIWMSDLWFSMTRWLVGEKGWQPMRSGYCEGVEQR